MTRHPMPAVDGRGGPARWIRILIVPVSIAIGACFGVPTGDAWNGPPFSADLVDLRNGGGRVPTHVYVGVGRLRMESAEPGKTTAFIFDPQKGTLLVIDKEAKTYIDAGMFSSLAAAEMTPMLRLFRPAQMAIHAPRGMVPSISSRPLRSTPGRHRISRVLPWEPTS